MCKWHFIEMNHVPAFAGTLNEYNYFGLFHYKSDDVILNKLCNISVHLLYVTKKQLHIVQELIAKVHHMRATQVIQQ